MIKVVVGGSKLKESINGMMRSKVVKGERRELEGMRVALGTTSSLGINSEERIPPALPLGFVSWDYMITSFILPARLSW